MFWRVALKGKETGGGSGRCWVGSRCCRYQRDREMVDSIAAESVLPAGG